MKTNRRAWRSGIKVGIPIGLGYFAVSFTFGIIAKQAGLNPFEAGIMSATNFTSAGQFAGLTLIATVATILEITLTQLIINSRYFLMSFALSQKIDPNTPFFHRLILAFGITDEVFGVSVAAPGKLNPFYTYGVMSVALPGWVLGTLLGIISGNVLPERLMSALSIALYGMLLAVIIPPAKGNKILSGLIVISMGLSLLFAVLPFLQTISSGVKIIVLTFLIAGIAAFLFPIKEHSHE
ncbi:AzlC family ABC transporter permease [Bacillus aquiflavi]|uniref:AzlC family ABC transporter permease n=1 Tax=Bacillus aquiflavi TaxID=2672567 RepID=A0A6B3W4T9_9BACI|nr:AzlC family ABC transporter permease [Bacillus aquiflavi]MBA4538164.1 AzlC family ABC transporter permease [Bacillus aquiflavi]NEY82484.1 AzlC family ABC transporter permease [Bacillus aquiflavi]UAC48106.1 AzlC family ABC transporter permease [Bacillus aquiflavi]